MAYYPPQQPPRRRLGGLAITAIVLGSVFVLFVGCSAILAAGRPAAPASSSDYTAPEQSTVPAAAAEPAAPAGIGDGTWIVGVDLQPGTYRSQGAREGFFEFCSWSTKAGASTNSKVLDFGAANANEPMIVEISSKVKAFDTSNCEPWVKVD